MSENGGSLNFHLILSVNLMRSGLASYCLLLFIFEKWYCVCSFWSIQTFCGQQIHWLCTLSHIVALCVWHICLSCFAPQPWHFQSCALYSGAPFMWIFLGFEPDFIGGWGGGGDALCLEAPCGLEIAVHKSECPWLFFRSASQEWEWLHRLPRRVLLWLSDNHAGWVWPGKIHQSGTVCLPRLWTRVRDLTVFYRDEVDLDRVGQ